MKAKVLKKLLNTEREVADYGDYIGIGSAYVHKILSVDKKTLEIEYALDTFRKGRSSINNSELEMIWDKLHDLVDNGQMKEIIEGDDVFENPIPIFYAKDGKIIETTTDEYVFPNTTKEGVLMYTNTHFKTKQEAIDHGIDEYVYMVKVLKENAERRRNELKEAEDNVAKYQGWVDGLKNNKKGSYGNPISLEDSQSLLQDWTNNGSTYGENPCPPGNKNPSMFVIYKIGDGVIYVQSTISPMGKFGLRHNPRFKIKIKESGREISGIRMGVGNEHYKYIDEQDYRTEYHEKDVEVLPKPDYSSKLYSGK